MHRKKFIGFVGNPVLMLAVALAATAAEKPSAGNSKTRIVLVGIGKYADNQIKPRLHAEDDAKALYDLFTDKKYLGVDHGHIRLLLGKPDEKHPSEPATRDNILKALHWAVSSSGTNDLVIFALIAQGAPLDERICYFATDSTFKDRAKNALAAADIERELGNLNRAARLCAFIDVSFRGFDPGNDPEPDANPNSFYKEFFGNDDQEEFSPRPGRVVFFATTGLGQAIDLEEHGSFTQVLLDGLSGKADTYGYEPDGLVTVGELAEYVDKQLVAIVRKHAKTPEGRRLYPSVIGSRSSHYVLTRNPAAAGRVQERLQKLATLAQGNKLSKERADEGHMLLELMPKLEAQQSLRKKYQQLVDGVLSVGDFENARTKILEGAKLERSQALSFASKVMQATEIIRSSYIKEEKQQDLVMWAIQGLFQRLDEKVPLDLQQRMDHIKDVGEKELTALLADARERLGKREDLENQKDLNIAMMQMTSHLDPYSTYLPSEGNRQFGQEIRSRFTGIGVQIRKDDIRDMLVVVSPIRGSPAYRAKPTNQEIAKGKEGLQEGDIITQIIREEDRDGNPLEKPEVISTKGMTLEEAVQKIIGKAGTKIKLIVERKGFDKPLEFEITRGAIKLETVVGIKRNEDDSWDFALDAQKMIYYIRINSFSNDTSYEVARILRRISKEGVRGLILDLRFNPGGLLGTAVSIADLFIDDGLIVTMRARAQEEPYVGHHEGSYLNFPMVCLVNAGTTDVSEIVAACLQDHKRALIVGERSAGKGTYQHMQPFEGGELKLSTASLRRPSGKSLVRIKSSKEDDDWGVMPDKGFFVKLSASERDKLFEYQHGQEIIPRRDRPAKEQKSEFKDRQLEKSLDYLRGLIKTAARPARMK